METDLGPLEDREKGAKVQVESVAWKGGEPPSSEREGKERMAGKQMSWQQTFQEGGEKLKESR